MLIPFTVCLELYSKSLIEFKPTPQDSISQLYKEILEFEKRNKSNLSKALFNNLRAALRLYFLMETGMTFKTYKSSLVLPDVLNRKLYPFDDRKLYYPI